MLTFATARDASLDEFLSVSAASRYQEELRAYLETLLQQRFTKPDWCLVGREEGVPVARAALWALSGQAVPTDLVLIEADWADEELSAGQALLSEAHDLARALRADALSHHVDAPPQAPQYQEDEEDRIRLLVEAGYEFLRDGLRWRYSGTLSPQGEALDFRPLPEVGEETFVAAMAATYEGTRDSWITQTIEEHGALGAARADFADYQGLEHEPEWWELAYAPSGELAGVVMAARNPSSAVVAYVGVVPEQRGRGLAAELVRHATEQLLAHGQTTIGGDCDRDNIGMVKAFERAGYEQIARRRSYRRAL